MEESRPIEWQEFKEAFLGNYFPRERRELMVEDFINIKKGNMRVDEYSLKFPMLSRYALHLCLIQEIKFVVFFMGVADLVRE